jgi:murein L,D-transpeptidase YafK
LHSETDSSSSRRSPFRSRRSTLKSSYFRSYRYEPNINNRRKSKYRLTVYYRQQPIKSYPFVLGQNPVGDKAKEGDYKTPEGIFNIRDLYPHPSWSKFLWLDDPNSTSWRKHFNAKLNGKIGLLDSVGSEVGIHRIARKSESFIDEQIHWTWGCISLKNKVIDEIYSAVKVGTIVEILP